MGFRPNRTGTPVADDSYETVGGPLPQDTHPFSVPSDVQAMLRFLLKWMPIGLLAGVLGGRASAPVLWSLQVATNVREAHYWLIALLPLAGLAVGCMYRYLGTSVEAGNNLILDEV